MMSSLLRKLIVCVAVCPLFLACESEDTEGWQPAAIDGADAYYSSVWGSSPNDIFLVGGVRGALIYHFDGSRWEEMIAPDKTPALIWVFGFASNDVYAVGERGAFIHYDGERWTELDSNTAKVLWGVWGTSSDDLWLVGGEIARGRPTIRHWNGSESEVFEVDPSQYDENMHALFKVWGDGSNVYAVGQRGTILRYAGSSWDAMETGESQEPFTAIWGAGGEVVAVGGFGSGRVARLQGDSFTTTTPEGVGGLSAVYVCPDRILVGGAPGFVGSLEGGDITIETFTLNPVHGLWSDCGGTSAAVGGLFIDPPSSAVATLER